MPINKSLMEELIKKYGPKKGREIYYKMESKGDKATKPAAVKKSRKGPISKAMS